MYFCGSGNFPLSLNPFDGLNNKLPLFNIFGEYSPGPKGLVYDVTFLGDLPKVVNVDE